MFKSTYSFSFIFFISFCERGGKLLAGRKIETKMYLAMLGLWLSQRDLPVLDLRFGWWLARLMHL